MQISYEAGDHVAVYAENSAQTVEATAQHLGVSLDTVFRLSMPARSSCHRRLQVLSLPSLSNASPGARTRAAEHC